jgi:hypothetical protein
MKRVALIVTGKAEEALSHALTRVFPEVEFIVRPPRDGFTSPPLPHQPALHSLGTATRPTNVERLAEVLVAEVAPGRRDQRTPDMVILVDDLELVNAAWPERVTQHIRTAVRAHLERFPWPTAASREAAFTRIRERCSFHVLAPMLEAYFFAEPAALTRAGAKAASKVDASTMDLEKFLSTDNDFLTPPDRPRGSLLPPWAIAERAHHPKSYLQFLCDRSGTIARAYVETVGGRAALRELDWSAVLALPSYTRFLRSLLHDLSSALEDDSAIERFPGDTHPCTWPPPRDNLLRNI